MGRQDRSDRVEKWIFRILILGSLLVNIKNIFTSFDVDAEYALAMPYRMLRGDEMISQMWEPHQTSAFLAAAFMKPYLALFQTTTGIAVYMNFVGVCLKGAVTVILYRTLKNCADRKALLCACILFFTMNPKNILIPEFSNMQVWFSVLLFCSLFQYFRNQEKKGWLLLAGVFLCLEVLAYPSCVIVYFGVLLCLARYAGNRRADILLLTGECALAGGLYVLYFVSRMGVGELLGNIREIIQGDTSHGESVFVRLKGYGNEALWILAVMLLSAALSCIMVRAFVFVKSRGHGTEKLRPTGEWYILCFLLCLCVQALIGTVAIMMGAGREDAYFQHHIRQGYQAVFFIVLSVLGWRLCRSCSEEAARACRTGILLSLCSIAAVLTLTNLTVFSALLYGILGVCVSLAACVSGGGSRKRGRLWLLILYCGITIFQSGVLIVPLSGHQVSIFEARGIVRSGPAMGLISTYMGPYMINSTMQEWERYIEPGDRLLIVGSTEAASTVGYLYEDTEVCADSTICTPTYNEKLERYWKKNPQKYPNVVAVECWYGELHIDEDSWIMRWLENEFQADTVADGKYWRYYLKEN